MRQQHYADTFVCADCGTALATCFNPDGRYRCRPCQREHVRFVRAVLADTGARRIRRAIIR
jgi:hypothetical protein